MSIEHVRALAKTVSAAMFSPGQPAKPGQEIEIAGKKIRVEYFVTNRKCYDFLPTPTVKFTIDGKRASRAAAYEIAKTA